MNPGNVFRIEPEEPPLPKPLHLLFVKVEYDPNYSGGDYHKTGYFVLLPVPLCEALNVRKAFKKVTGLDSRRIVNYCPDELYDIDGNLVTDFEDVFARYKEPQA